VRTRDGAHEQDDGQHRQTRCGHGRGPTDATLGAGIQHRGTGTGQHQQERAEQLAEQPAPFVGQIIEIPRPDRLPHHQLCPAGQLFWSHHQLDLLRFTPSGPGVDAGSRVHCLVSCVIEGNMTASVRAIAHPQAREQVQVRAARRDRRSAPSR